MTIKQYITIINNYKHFKDKYVKSRILTETKNYILEEIKHKEWKANKDM